MQALSEQGLFTLPGSLFSVRVLRSVQGSKFDVQSSESEFVGSAVDVPHGTPNLEP